jgi:hypothetical protein
MGKGMFQTNSKHINSRRRIKIVNICWDCFPFIWPWCTTYLS